MENLRDFIDVVVKEKGFLFGKKLTINIREKQHLPGAKYRIKVMHDKAVVYNSGFSKRKNYVYFVNKTGSWIIFADAEVKGRSFNHIRESIWTYSKQQKQDYRDFLNTPYTTTASELPLAKLRDPYRNTALICSSQEKMRDLNLKSFVETTDKSLYMYSNGICAGGGTTFILCNFTGKA